MPLTEDQVKAALGTVKYPGFSRDIVSFGLVKGIDLGDGDVVVQLALATNDPAIPQTIKSEAEAALGKLAGVRSAKIRIDIQAPPAGSGSAGVGATKISGIKHVLAIASGKGGVGKSTVAANLALALQQTGAAVGLCDCDIYGPSISLMFGSRERPMATEENRIIPIEQHGLRLMSMGFLLEDTSPAILRGPMVTRYTQQFLRQVEWGELDYLVLDLPPGTGDIPISLAQLLPRAELLVVTTPQPAAADVAVRAGSLARRTGSPIVGVVENMAWLTQPDGARLEVFGSGGGAAVAASLSTREDPVGLLAQVPLDTALREGGDRGLPVVLGDPGSPAAVALSGLAAHLGQRPRGLSGRRLPVSVGQPQH